GVAMRFFDGDVVDVFSTVLDGDDLVFPFLLLEPATLEAIPLERLLLAGEPESDPPEERADRSALDQHVPGLVLVRTSSAEDAEVEEQDLHLLRKLFARGAEDHALRSRIGVAIEIRAQEIAHDGLG